MCRAWYYTLRNNAFARATSCMCTCRSFTGMIRIVILLLTLLPALVQAQVPAFTLTAKLGPHPVGARVVYHHDSSRNLHGQPRPIQTIVFYPATGASKRKLTWGGYTYLDLTDTVRRTLSPADSLAWRSKGMYGRFIADSSLIAQHFDLPAAASWDAPARAGKHPMVLYAASFGAPVWENAPFCEYLASHGYVVVAVPSLGATQRAMTFTPPGVLAQVADLQFVLRWLQQQPEWDGKPIGLAGFSWGGASGPLTAGRAPEIIANVAWDGSIRYFPPQVLADCGVDTTKGLEMQAAFLYMSRKLEIGHPGMDTKPILSFPAWNAIKATRGKTYVQFNKLEHGDFSANHHLFEHHGHPNPTPVAERHRQYNRICELTKAFLDQHVRGTGTGLQLTPAEIKDLNVWLYQEPISRNR